MTVGGTVRGITRLFGGVPRRRDLGQRSMYGSLHFGSSILNANFHVVVRLHLPGHLQCMSIIFHWASNPRLMETSQRIETHRENKIY
jgi:hypothetical protein